MTQNKIMKVALAFRNRDVATSAAQELGAVLIASNRDETDHLPFDSLVIGATDTLGSHSERADVGSWLICERTIKSKPISELDPAEQPGCVGAFTMVAHPELGAAASDAHWRDNHAPLALEIHTAMTHYYQLSVQHTFSGPEWNGFALCCFANEEDLRTRFYNSKEGEKAIGKDVAKFADTKRSPRRVIADFKQL